MKDINIDITALAEAEYRDKVLPIIKEMLELFPKREKSDYAMYYDTNTGIFSFEPIPTATAKKPK